MNLERLKYSKEWLEYNFISEEEVENQNLEFENGEDTNTEHYRYKSFLNWIKNRSYFTNEQIHQFIHLVDIDEDQGMVGSAICELYKSEKLSFIQKETIKNKLLSFGDWAVKFVKKDEAKFKESFNEEFCQILEYHLCGTFRNSDQKQIRRLWCDGVVCNHFSKKHVFDKREIETMAWIGEGGQDEYDMKIKFGKYSLRRYAKGTEMIDCIPGTD